MKKVLLTSTALVAFAGAAAAEVTLSGSAEMGVIGGENIESQFMQSIDVRFTLSGETDNGLTFGGTVDLADVEDSRYGYSSGPGDFNNWEDGLEDIEDFFDSLQFSDSDDLDDVTGFADFTVFISGEFGTVTMGDTDGALDWAMTDAASIGNPGSILDNETGHLGRQDTYLDGAYDGQVLRYDYAYEGFGFAVSVEQDDTYETDNDYNWALGVKWTGEAGPGVVKLGAGYQASDQGSITFGTDTNNVRFSLATDATVWGVSAAYEMDAGFSIGGTYSVWDAEELDSGSHWAIGGGYSFDAFSIHANYGVHDFEDNSGNEATASGYGVAAGYDLGGGLSILAGYGYSDLEVNDVDGDTSNWSFGASMSF